MIKARRDRRRDEIEAAAYGVLEAKGFAAMSMLAVARAAGASNETLYRWYGDKTGLLAALISRNADAAAEAVEAATAAARGLEAELETVGEALLGMLVGPRAVALNRAAAGDSSGTLGRALAEGGRSRIMPLIAGLLARHGAGGAELFLALLVGDWQVRRVTGAMAPPSDPEIRACVAQAVADFLVLLRAGQVNGR